MDTSGDQNTSQQRRATVQSSGQRQNVQSQVNQGQALQGQTGDQQLQPPVAQTGQRQSPTTQPQPSAAQPLPIQEPASQQPGPQAPAFQQPQQGQGDQPQAPQPEEARPMGAKEEEFVSSVRETEKVPVVEIKEPGELPVEVEGWIERVERDDVAEPKTVVHQGQPIVSPAAPQQVQVTLPLDDSGIKKGLQQQMAESIRWLAEWCLRLLKVDKGKVRQNKK